jgi:hypothetical protein
MWIVRVYFAVWRKQWPQAIQFWWIRRKELWVLILFLRKLIHSRRLLLRRGKLFPGHLWRVINIYDTVGNITLEVIDKQTYRQDQIIQVVCQSGHYHNAEEIYEKLEMKNGQISINWEKEPDPYLGSYILFDGIISVADKEWQFAIYQNEDKWLLVGLNERTYISGVFDID